MRRRISRHAVSAINLLHPMGVSTLAQALAGTDNRLTFVGSDDGTSLELAGYRAGVGA